MPQKEPASTSGVFQTTVPEDAAQVALLNVLAGLKSLKTDLRTIYETLGEPEGADAMSEGTAPETPAFFIRSSIECVFDDLLDPLVATLGKAALMTPEELQRAWRERQRTE